MNAPVDDGTRLGRDLAELERTDMSVRAAAVSLERYYESLAARGDIPRTRFRKSTPDRPCEVIR